MSASKPMPVPITGGMRQDQSEHVAPPGTLMDAVNVRLSTVGEIESRPGTTALSAASDADVSLGDIWNGTGVLGDVPGGFIVGSEGFAYRYDFGKSRLHVAGSYANAEPIGILNVVAREELQTTDALLAPFPLSQAAANGYFATLYSTGNGQGGYGPVPLPADEAYECSLHVFTEGGAPVTTSTFFNSVTTAAFLAEDGSNSTGMVVVRQSDTTGLTANVIATSATGVTIGADVSVGTLSANAAFWAICHHPGVGWLIVYQSGATTMSVKSFAGTTQQGSTVTFAVTGTCPVSIYSDGTNVYVGWRDDTGLYSERFIVYSAALAVVTATTVISTGIMESGPPVFGPHLTAGTATYVYSTGTLTFIDENTSMVVGQVTALGVVTQLQVLYQCDAASAPFGPGYVWARTGGRNGDASIFSRYLLLDFMTQRSAAASNQSSWGPVVALTCSLFVSGINATYSAGRYRQHVATPQQLSDGSWVMGLPRIVRNENGFGLAIGEWYNFTIGGTRQTTPFAGNLIAAGTPTLASSNLGTVHYTAGASPLLSPQRDGIDLGFPLPPAMVASSGVGSGTLSGLYQLRAVIERIDSAGRRWRSAPSSVVSVTASGANDTISVTGLLNTQWLRASTRKAINSRFVMHVYSTRSGGSTFYRATPPQGAPVGTTTSLFSFTLLTEPTGETEILYTDGGVLPNDCPPSCRFVRATEDRIWLGGLWESEQLQSSKIIVPGEPPQFSDSPAFRVALPEPCTGIAYQDGTVIAFTRTGIYAIQGAGPNDQGQGAWDTPRNVTRSSGCVNHLSIVETSVGVFYQSIRGIELLPRGLGEPIFVGMAVQDTLGTTTVRSASVVSTGKARSVRFCYGATTAGSVNVLVYDLDTQAWGRDLYPLAISGICDTENGAVLATGDPDADADYGFLLELDTSATDKSNTTAIEIASSLTWARLRPFGVAGMGRFQGAVGLFDAESPGYRAGNATVGLTVDSQTEQGFTFNMNTLSGASYRRVAPQFAEGTAGRLTLTTTVSGWRFMGWTVELEEIGGSRRVSETEQG